MITSNLLLTKYRYRVEGAFLFILFLVAISTFVYGQTKKQVEHLNINQPTVVSTESDQYISLYNEFWQRFNTTAALSADYNDDSIVSQSEVDMFKTDLLNRYGFVLSPENDLYILDQDGNIIAPDRMACYLKNFKPKRDSQQFGIDKC